MSKEEKILEYIRQNGSISSQEAADVGGYKSKTGVRKLLDKMIVNGLIKFADLSEMASNSLRIVLADMAKAVVGG